MKQILILIFIFCSLFAKSQTYMNEIKAKNNSNVAGNIGRVDVNLKVYDSAVLAKLNSSVAVTGTFWQATQPVSGTVSITANSAVNVAQINGITPLMGNGVTGTGSQRVTIASDNTAFTVNAAQSGTWNITNVSGTISLPTGASTSANQTTEITSLQLIDDVVHSGDATLSKYAVLGGVFDDVSPVAVTENNAQSLRMSSRRALYVETSPSGTFAITSMPTTTVTATNLSTNVAQINGVTPLMGNGVTGTGSPRVTLVSDGTAISTTGYMSVKLDQTTPGTTNGVSLVPTTTGGLTTFHLVSAASTNATNLKASAGQLYGYYVFNANASARKIAFHNTSGTPTAGASVFFSLVIPAGSGANVEFSQGIAFSSGIGITMVTGTADSDATGVAAGDLIFNAWFK